MNRRDFLQLVTTATAGVLVPQYFAHSSTITNSSHYKRGIALSCKPGSRWQEKIQKVGARWFYTWNKQPADDIPANVEFVPMIWNGKTGDPNMELGYELRKGEYRALLGFNEPDQKIQGNMTVEEALEMWPRLMESGLRLGSPSCVHPDNDWMKQFMNSAKERQLRVDFVCVHSYGGPNAEALMKRLKSVHEMFQKPIWITEFAVGDWKAKTREDNRYKPEQVVEFVQSILPLLDASDFVEKYAWFVPKPESATLGPCALFNADGSLTSVGEAYRTA